MKQISATLMIDQIRKEIRDGGNVNVVITGLPRSGKSLTMESIAYAFNPAKWTIENTAWDIQPFIELYNKAEKGSILKFDEAGVGMSSREWYEKKNKKLTFIIQTYGFKNLLVIMTTPSFDFIDVTARKLFHHYIHINKKYKNKGYVSCKWRWIKYNPQNGKTYLERPIVRVGNAGIRVNGFKIRLPPKFVIDAYNRKSEEWKQKFGEIIEKELSEVQVKKPTDEELFQRMIAEPEKFISKKTRKGYKVTASDLQVKLNLSRDKAWLFRRKFLDWMDKNKENFHTRFNVNNKESVVVKNE